MWFLRSRMRRRWKPTFTSAVTYGVVRVVSLDIQPLDALQQTQRGTMNSHRFAARRTQSYHLLRR